VRWIAMIAVMVSGCTAPDGGDPPGPTPDEVVIDQGVCADAWGPVPDGGRIFVDGDADGGGDGSIDAPFDTILDGIFASRAGGIRSIAIAPGEYEYLIQLNASVPGWPDGGLEIAGCGEDQTTLLATVDYEELPGGGILQITQPNVVVSGVGSDGIVLRDFTAIGGRRAITIRDGAGFGSPVIVQRVTLEDSIRAGVVVDGLDTVAHLLSMTVDDVLEEDGLGRGISIQTSAWVTDTVSAPTEIDDTTVTGAVGAGILAEGGWNTLTDVTVTGTQSFEGQLGRGIQLQNRTRATLVGVTSTGNADAGLFVHLAGREGVGVDVIDSDLSGTVEAEVGNTGSLAADGLSVSNGSDPGATSLMVTVTGTQFGGNARADVLVDGASVELGEGNSFGQDGAYGVVAQADGLVQGPDGGPPDASVTELADADSLALQADAIGLDGLEE